MLKNQIPGAVLVLNMQIEIKIEIDMSTILYVVKRIA